MTESRFESLHVTAKESFDISLHSRPQSGFSWELVQVGDNEKSHGQIVQLVHMTWISQPGYQGALQVFHFSALERGAAKLVFSYKRSWETVALKQATYQVTVH